MPPLPFAAFTFGDGLLTVVELAFFFLWIWIAVGVVFDVFRSSDLSNTNKALWVLFIFIFPLLGVLAYLIIRGHTMHEHQAQDAARFASFRPPPRGGGSGGGAADDLSTLADLKDRGVLTAEEFERAKGKVLS
jgi:hypothetical protein